jgi:hypothetical protein
VLVLGSYLRATIYSFSAYAWLLFHSSLLFTKPVLAPGSCWVPATVYHFCACAWLLFSPGHSSPFLCLCLALVESRPQFTISVLIVGSCFSLGHSSQFLCLCLALVWVSATVYHFCACAWLLFESRPQFIISVLVPGSCLSLGHSSQFLCLCLALVWVLVAVYKSDADILGAPVLQPRYIFTSVLLSSICGNNGID